jgi:hypothetical protein
VVINLPVEWAKKSRKAENSSAIVPLNLIGIKFIIKMRIYCHLIGLSHPVPDQCVFSNPPFHFLLSLHPPILLPNLLIIFLYLILDLPAINCQYKIPIPQLNPHSYNFLHHPAFGSFSFPSLLCHSQNYHPKRKHC